MNAVLIKVIEQQIRLLRTPQELEAYITALSEAIHAEKAAVGRIIKESQKNNWGKALEEDIRTLQGAVRDARCSVMDTGNTDMPLDQVRFDNARVNVPGEESAYMQACRDALIHQIRRHTSPLYGFGQNHRNVVKRLNDSPVMNFDLMDERWVEKQVIAEYSNLASGGDDYLDFAEDYPERIAGIITEQKVRSHYYTTIANIARKDRLAAVELSEVLAKQPNNEKLQAFATRWRKAANGERLNGEKTEDLISAYYDLSEEIRGELPAIDEVMEEYTNCINSSREGMSPEEISKVRTRIDEQHFEHQIEMHNELCEEIFAGRTPDLAELTQKYNERKELDFQAVQTRARESALQRLDADNKAKNNAAQRQYEKDLANYERRQQLPQSSRNRENANHLLSVYSEWLEKEYKNALRDEMDRLEAESPIMQEYYRMLRMIDEAGFRAKTQINWDRAFEMDPDKMQRNLAEINRMAEDEQFRLTVAMDKVSGSFYDKVRKESEQIRKEAKARIMGDTKKREQFKANAVYFAMAIAETDKQQDFLVDFYLNYPNEKIREMLQGKVKVSRNFDFDRLKKDFSELVYPDPVKAMGYSFTPWQLDLRQLLRREGLDEYRKREQSFVRSTDRLYIEQYSSLLERETGSLKSFDRFVEQLNSLSANDKRYDFVNSRLLEAEQRNVQAKKLANEIPDAKPKQPAWVEPSKEERENAEKTALGYERVEKPYEISEQMLSGIQSAAAWQRFTPGEKAKENPERLMRELLTSKMSWEEIKAIDEFKQGFSMEYWDSLTEEQKQSLYPGQYAFENAFTDLANEPDRWEAFAKKDKELSDRLWEEANLTQKIKWDVKRAVRYCVEHEVFPDVIRDQGEKFADAYWEEASWKQRRLFDEDKYYRTLSELPYEEINKVDDVFAAKLWNEGSWAQRFTYDPKMATSQAMAKNLSIEDALGIGNDFAAAYLRDCDEAGKDIGANLGHRAGLENCSIPDYCIAHSVPLSEVEAYDKRQAEAYWEKATASQREKADPNKLLDEWKKLDWDAKNSDYYKDYTARIWKDASLAQKVEYDREHAKLEFYQKEIPLEELDPIEAGEFTKEYWEGLSATAKKESYQKDYDLEWKYANWEQKKKLDPERAEELWTAADWSGKKNLDPERAEELWTAADWSGKKNLDKDTMKDAWAYFSTIPAGERAIDYRDDAVAYEKYRLGAASAELTGDALQTAAEQKVAGDAIDEFKKQRDLVEHLKDQWKEMKSHSISLFDSKEFSNMKSSFTAFTKAYENIVIKGLSAGGEPSADKTADLARLTELQEAMKREAKAYADAKREQKSGGISRHKSEQGRDRLAMADALMEFSLGITKEEPAFEIDGAAIGQAGTEPQANAETGTRRKVSLKDLEQKSPQDRRSMAREDLQARRARMLRREQEAAAHGNPQAGGLAVGK